MAKCFPGAREQAALRAAVERVPIRLRWVDVKRAAEIIGSREETVRTMCVARSIRSERVGPKLWRVWIDAEGLPGEPGCPVNAPGLIREDWGEIGDAAAQCDMHPETIRLLCVDGTIRARKVGGTMWRVWLTVDGLVQLIILPAES